MKIMPENRTILCERITNDTRDVIENNFSFQVKELPVYRVLSVSPGISEWKPGDVIICNSTGTKLDVDENKVQYLFNVENIAGIID